MFEVKMNKFVEFEKCSKYGDMVYLSEHALIDDGCINRYNWNYRGAFFELYWNCNTHYFEIYCGYYALKNIDKKVIFSHEFSMNEIVEEAFPVFVFDDFIDDVIEDFENFEDVEWID